MRTSVKASLAVALLLATAAAAAGLGAGSGSASRRAGTPPASIDLPAITGLQVGQTLSVTPGRWAGDQPMTFEYTWQRSEGNTFKAIPGVASNATSYTLTDADIGHNLLVQVKAINAAGWAWGTSVPTTHVNGATAGDTVDLGGGLIGVSAKRVTLPNRLVVSAADFSPTALAPGGSLTATVHVTDTAGHPVSGALVQAIGLPFGSIKPTAEVPTGADGTARITLAATAQLAQVPGGAIALSIRARKDGDNVLAGVTATRLVKLSITH